MRMILSVLTVLTLLACEDTSSVIVGNKTSLEVERVYDAGEVIKGEMITARFNVKNTGDYPLVIAEVKGSCSCTVAEYPDDPLQPGETAEIMAHVDTDKVGTGVINKAVRIVANTEPSITQLTIKAVVRAK